MGVDMPDEPIELELSPKQDDSLKYLRKMAGDGQTFQNEEDLMQAVDEGRRKKKQRLKSPKCG
jgi:hypothetical protein